MVTRREFFQVSAADLAALFISTRDGIVEYEDNEMMRPYRIGPADPKAPKK